MQQQPDGLTPVPPGKIATVVTHLEMTEKPDLRPAFEPAGVTIDHQADPDVGWYRDLYRRVGGHDWLWFSRLILDDAELTAEICAEGVEVFSVQLDGTDVGLLELDFSEGRSCHLAFLGLTSGAIGKGIGRWLMNVAITRAWGRPIDRLKIHTCTLDHPAALGFYRRSGFVPVRQEIEVADDPRLTGAVPEGAGPHVPVIRD